MERDRVACLLQRVAAEQLYDFEQHNPLEPQSARRLRLAIRALVAKSDSQRSYALTQYYSTAMSLCSQDDFPKIQEQVLHHLEHYEHQLMPWRRDLKAVAEQRTVRQLYSAWEQEFGRMDDPETQAGIERTVQALRAMRAEKKEHRAKLAAARHKILQRSLERTKRNYRNG